MSTPEKDSLRNKLRAFAGQVSPAALALIVSIYCDESSCDEVKAMALAETIALEISNGQDAEVKELLSRAIDETHRLKSRQIEMRSEELKIDLEKIKSFRPKQR